jgi:MazG family protein
VKVTAGGNGPDYERAKAAFARLCATIAALRNPEGGCPWDLQQDHVTLRRFMIEEAYEAAEAMAAGEPVALRDELGDVLLQVMLNAQVAKDRGSFDVVDVVEAINEKMRRRHPHVFGDEQARAAGHVQGNWEAIKAAEKSASGKPRAGGYFAEAADKQPASLQALKIGKLAAKIRFDWDDVHEVFGQVKSEVDELAVELAAATVDKDTVAEEIGDVFFSLAQLCRHLELDPELVAFDANRKFLRRFAALEAVAKERGVNVERAPRQTLEELWVEVKRREKKRP